MPNANILAQLVAPTFQSPVETYSRGLQLDNAVTQNQLARFQLGAAQRQEAEGEQLAAAYKTALDPTSGRIDYNRVTQALAQSGAGRQIPGVVKQAGEQRRADAELTKIEAETRERNLKLIGGALGALGPNPTRQGVMGAMGMLKSAGVDVNPLMAEIPQDDAQLPDALRRIALTTEHGLAIMKAVAPQLDWRNNGQVETPYQSNPLAAGFGAPVQGVAPIQRMATPGEVMTDERTRSEGAANRNVTLRGQNLSDARAREQLAAGGRQFDSERGVIVNTREGTASPVMVGGAPLGAKMSESAKKEVQGIDAQLNTVAAAIEAAKAAPDAFGVTRGLATMAGTLPETAANAMSSDKNIQARSFVFNIVSKVINERAGAAQSAQELSRLRSFLPAETDNAKVIESKLNGFQSYLAEQRKAYAQPARMDPGDGGAAPKPRQPAPEVMDALPDPAKYLGRVAKGDDGTLYKSDGKNWVKQ